MGQVLINEILPAPFGGAPEWIELYNTTARDLNIGNCIIDDLADGGAWAATSTSNPTKGTSNN